MPLTLRPPGKGKTSNYGLRGTYLGHHLETTAGTPDKKIADGILKDIKRGIECAEYRPSKSEAPPREPTFADAALAYLQADGDGRFLGRIIEATDDHALRDKPLRDIDQLPIDRAVSALYPGAPATTRNHQGHTPISALLKHAGIEGEMLKLAMTRAPISLPPRQAGFHIFCHTYGTWMKRYGRLDTFELTRTGRWKDPESADRYNHTEASWEAQQADLLPVAGKQPARRKAGTGNG